MNANKLNLRQLEALRKRWLRLPAGDRRGRALSTIQKIIANREQGTPQRCALPKKKQRELGMLPPVGGAT
jgi:hypothetical protein